MATNAFNELVSIVVPTYNRATLAKETILHIIQQTYKHIEIIVVIDGQDEITLSSLRILHLKGQFIPFRIIQLGHNWSGLDRSSFGIAPLLVGYLAAKGTYLMPWCDDERALRADHIEMLVRTMESPISEDFGRTQGGFSYPDFVYPQVHIWRNNNPYNHENTVIGKPIPEHGQITHYMFSYMNFVKFGYPDWGSHPMDWSLIQKWMRNGAKWTFIPEVTFEHRLDQ